MKKLSILLMAIAMLTVFTAPSHAMLRKDIASVKGTVVYINAARNEITIKDMTTGRDVSFTSSGVSGDIMSGKPVIVLYKKGTTHATTVRLVDAKKAAAMTKAPASPMTYQAPKATSAAATTTTAPAKSKYGW